MPAIANEWMILIIIAGAAFSVLLGYALFRFFVPQEEGGIKDFSNEQKEYMRQVRRGNMGLNHFEAREARHERQRYTESSMG
jgi:hypothetical protein